MNTNFQNHNNVTEYTRKQNIQRNETEIDIPKLIGVLISKLWIIALAALLAAVAAYVWTSKFVTPMYKSTARVYILNRQNSSATSATDLTSATSIKEDFLILIKSSEVYRQVLDKIGEDPNEYRSLVGKVSTDNNTSRFVDITITDADPIRAKMLVDAFADVSRVKAKTIMGVEDVTIEEYGTIPVAPSSPSMTKNIILAVLVGIVISCGIIVLLTITNNTIATPEDIEKKTGLSVLGVIPDVSAHSQNNRTHKNAKKDKTTSK